MMVNLVIGIFDISAAILLFKDRIARGWAAFCLVVGIVNILVGASL